MCIINRFAETPRGLEEGSEKRAFHVIGNGDEGKEISKTDTYLNEEAEHNEKGLRNPLVVYRCSQSIRLRSEEVLFDKQVLECRTSVPCKILKRHGQ